MIKAAINQRVVFKPDKLSSPSATPYRESTQKIPAVNNHWKARTG
jgi:hypothetical protein